MVFEKIIEIIKNPDLASYDQLDEVQDLSKKHPYCQTLYIVSAKIAFDNESEDKQRFLTKAALYIPDRTHLKKLIENQIDLKPKEIKSDVSESLIVKDEPAISTSEVITDAPKEELTATEINVSENSFQIEHEKTIEAPEVNFAEELMENLEKVQKSILNYNEKEREFNEYIEEIKRQKAEAAKNFDVILNYLDKVEPTLQINDSLAEHQQNQINLIDQFIQGEAKRKRFEPNLPVVEESLDLSERYSSISDELISENLAIIMRKQGKLNQAIDIYKKLIWKFPQKKTYFASQIQEIENL